MPQFQDLLRTVPGKSLRTESAWDSLSALKRRSLVVAHSPLFRMHGLVRRNAQLRFCHETLKIYQQAHQRAGEDYFPLTKKGNQRAHPIPAQWQERSTWMPQGAR
jgi:hypothetical protein